MSEDNPRWVAMLLGVVSLFMGTMVLLTVAGVIPAEGRMLAPPWIVGSVGGLFVFAGLLMFVPEDSLQSLRVLLFLVFTALVAIVCNWSAFAPDVAYSSSSSLSLGPFSISGDGGGSRWVFILAALVLDGLLIAGVVNWAWGWVQGD
ncbi:MAG: hypothetical protein ACLFWD_12605 [Anaerolineales bacterium]